MLSKLLCLAVCLALPLAAAGGTAHVFTVTESADGEPGSLRSVIEEINEHPDVDPDSTFLIQFALLGSLITLEDSLPAIDKPRVTLEGPGRANLTISGDDTHRLFLLTPNVLRFEVSGLSLRNGNSGPFNAAGCLTSASETTVMVVRDVRVEHCQGRMGGAVGSQGPLYVHDSAFNSNTALGSLGARGGAIYAFGPAVPVEIRRSTFSFNTAIADPSPFSTTGGGALAFSTQAQVLVEDCQFTTNGFTNVSAGGAIWFQGGVLSLRRSTLDANVAVLGSAVMAAGTTSQLRLQNVTLLSNQAAGGGAVNIGQGSFWGRNNTFWNNQGDQGVDLQVGQLDQFSASHHVHGRETFLRGGLAPTHCIFDDLPPSTAIHHSMAMDASCEMDIATDMGAVTLEVFLNGGLLVVFDDTSPVVGGGATHADTDGIDAQGCEPLDARRIRRPMDGNGSGQARCDAGALEHGRFSWMFMSGFESFE